MNGRFQFIGDMNRIKVWSHLNSKPIRFLIILMLALALFLFLEQKYLKVTQRMEFDIQDKLMGWRNKNHTAASEEIVLIRLDEATIKKYDGAPPPRAVEAELIKALNQSGTKTIAFDFTFDMERKGTKDLVEASKRTDSLIYGVAFDEVDKKDGNLISPLPRLTPFKLSERNRALDFWQNRAKNPQEDYVLERIPCQELSRYVKHLGHIMFQVSFDGVVRRVPLIVKIEERYYPALSLIAVCLLKDVPFDGTGVTVKWGEYILLEDKKGWRRKIPIDKVGRMRLNYIGGVERFEQSYSFGNLERYLETDIPQELWQDYFGDKLILIGDGVSKADWTPTPFSMNFPGVAVHATAIDNILSGEFVHETPSLLTAFLSLCFSGVLVALQLCLFRPTPQKREYWNRVIIGVVILFCFASLYVTFAIASFHLWGRFLNLTLPLMVMLLSWLAVTYYCYEGELAEKRRLEHELKLAREVQTSLLPKDAPKIEGLEVAGVTLPAQEVGGDYFDYLQFEEEPTRIGIAVADVSGKGMKAAMVAVMSNCLLALAIQNSKNIGEVFTLMNGVLFSRTEKVMFTALCVATIDSKRLQMKFSNAGQADPILMRQGQLIHLSPEGNRIPLGIIKSSTYQENTVQLEPGDMVVFYTDGVIEAMNHAEEMYQEERLEKTLLNLTGAAEDCLDQILKDIDSFVAGAPQYDDLTLVIVRV